MKHPLLWLVLALATAPAQALEDRPKDENPVAVRFEISSRSPSPAAPAGRLKLTQVGLPSDSPMEISERLTAGKPIEVQLMPGTAWMAEVEALGFWVRRTAFSVASAKPQVLRLEAWPLGEIFGRLSAAEKTALPKKLIVTTLPSRNSKKSETPPKGEIECPIDSVGRFRCDLPAAEYDLSLLAEPFVPLYAWDVDVMAGKATDLKTLTLRRGTSLAGWVEGNAGSAIDLQTCRVILTPLPAAGIGNLGEAEKLSSMQRQVLVNPRGFFQFVGIEPGVYSVEVDQGKAFAEPRGPIRVVAGEETYLSEPFVLEAPFDLELFVDPPRDRHGHAWTVEVERALGRDFRTETVYQGRTSDDGEARVAHQRAGRYTVRIYDSTGQKMLTESDLAFDPSTGGRRVFEIRWIEVEGKVLLGKAPLRAALWFGGRHGLTSVRFDSDDEGRFEGSLPRGGHWLIEIEAAEPHAILEAHRTLDPKSGHAEIEITIPATRIFGRVVGAKGRPEDKAIVSVVEQSGANQWLMTDASGQFEFRGIAPGSLSLGAESRGNGGGATEQSLSLAEDGEVGPIELKLKEQALFLGRVLSSRGLEEGAAVTVAGARPARYGFGSGRSAKDGGFEVRLPAGVESAVAAVGVLGSSLTAFEMRPGQKADLVISEVGGMVEVDLGTNLGRHLTEQDAWIMLFQNGLELPSPALGAWVRTHRAAPSNGTTTSYPNLAPAEYTACLVPLSARLDMTRDGWSPDLAIECRTGTLAAGETLRLAFEGGAESNR